MPARKQMSLKQMEIHAKALCFDWNEKNPPGTTVDYESTRGSGKTQRAETKGEAFVSGCEAVVFISGVSGYVSVEHCKAVASYAVGA